MITSEKYNSFYSEKMLKKYELELLHWKDQFLYNLDEINFLKLFLNAEIFKPEIPNLFENLKGYLDSVEDLKFQNSRFYNLIEKELKILTDFFENEKIPEENFLTDFEKLRDDIEKYFDKYSDLKLEIFHYTGNLLKKNE